MAKELPYLSSYKNVEKLFKAIDAAKKPDALTTRVLADTFGIRGANDRPLISLLRTLGFLDQSNKPTGEYDRLKNPAQAKLAIAAGVRRAYAPLFEANERANSLSGEELRGLIAQVAGVDKGMAARIAGTFNSLTRLGDFNATADRPGDDPTDSDDEEEEGGSGEAERKEDRKRSPGGKGGLRPEFHYNIQIHLPDGATEDTYLNIFNAIRKTFK